MRDEGEDEYIKAINQENKTLSDRIGDMFKIDPHYIPPTRTKKPVAKPRYQSEGFFKDIKKIFFNK